MNPSLRERLLGALPYAAALLGYAAVLGRWALALPLALGMGWALVTRKAPRFSEGGMLVAVVAGGGLGFLAGLLPPELPASSLPSFVLSPVSGVLAVAGGYCLLANKRTWALVYACMLAVVSAHSRASFVELGVLALTVVAALVSGFSEARLGLPTLRRGMLGVVAFAAVACAAAGGIAAGLMALQGTLIELVGGTVMELMADQLPSFGVEERLVLGSFGQGSSSSKIVMEVSGEVPQLLRASVMDQYDGTAWSTSPGLAAQRGALPADAAGTRAKTELLFVRNLGGQLPSPAGVVSVAGTSPEVRGAWLLWKPDLRDLTLVLERSAIEALPPEPAPDAAATALPPAIKEEFGKLAKGIVGAESSPGRKARVIEAYFRDNFEYSLTAELRGRGHPLALLITGRRPAYCAYFASAMAVLLRSLDVPARVVGGFVPEGTSPLTGRAVVRARDAHAWVEAYLAEEGRWVAFDPTPWRTRDAAVGSERNVGWPAALAGWLSSSSRRLWILVRHPLDLLRAVGYSPVTWGLLVVFLVWRFRKGRTARVTFRAGQAMRPVDPRLEALYRRYLKLLRKAGIAPQPSETDDAVLERMRGSVGSAPAEAAARFVQAYRAVRYGGGQLDEAGLVRALEELRSSLVPGG